MKYKRSITYPLLAILIGCASFLTIDKTNKKNDSGVQYKSLKIASSNSLEDKVKDQRVRHVLLEARKWVDKKPKYNPSYINIKYPNGDIPDSIGVCTDLLIRSYRATNIDLQILVHDYFTKISHPIDTNIDHRRCRNLIDALDNSNLFLKLDNDSNFLPGDIVFWDLGHGIDHVGILSYVYLDDQPLVFHHLPVTPSEDYVLKKWKIMGHYRLANNS